MNQKSAYNHSHIRSLFRTQLVAALIIVLCACSGGRAEKPVPISISSPEKLLNQGIYQYNINNYQKATKNFEKALLQYRSIDNQTGIAKSCLNLAKSHMAVNNNNIAEDYLNKAESVIKDASLDGLAEHLHLLKSSLAINNRSYDTAQQELDSVLNSGDIAIKLAALKNQTKISFLLHADNNMDEKSTVLKNTSSRQQWLDKYKALQNNNPENTASHLASIYRFEAELAEIYSDKQTLMEKALSISRELADRPAIAATLVQSASIDLHSNNYRAAEDKLIRALFIRHQLGDVSNSIEILKQLDTVYIDTDTEKQKVTERWLKNLSHNDLTDWEILFSDFENYPIPQ